MTWFKRVLVTSAIMVPLSAWAFGPRPVSDRDAEEIAEHLASKLDLDDAVAAEVAERMMASREEGEALKERAREEANLLRSAIEDGDEKAMRASMKELERIKKERAAEAAKKAKEASDEAAAELDSSILQSNPLLDPTKLGAGSSFAVKRRWDDDVVFKNQSREPKKEGKRFINDTVRNDFHKRFLSKYVK